MIEFTLIGNLGADAVMNTNGEQKILNFAVCHSETWKNRPENKDKKYWVDCAYYSDSEELLELLKKGTQVYVKGTPNVGIHIKKSTNEPIAVQYLKVSKIEILSKKKREETIS